MKSSINQRNFPAMMFAFFFSKMVNVEDWEMLEH